MKSDGRITAVKARVVQDGGAYCSYGVVTILYSGALLGALYDIPNIQYDGYRVLTNKPACGAMRGHGTVNVRFAFESQLDELAAKIGMDPAEIRQRNLLQPPCITVNGSARAKLRTARVHRENGRPLGLEAAQRQTAQGPRAWASPAAIT